MAFLKDVFGKEEEKPKEKGPTDIPLEKVLNLRNQGLSNDQIIQTLQREGYKVDSIYHAISQADVKEGIESVPIKKLGETGDTMAEEAPTPPTEFPTESVPPPGEMPPAGEPPMAEAFPPAAIPPESTTETVQEVAEAIINEKWSELIGSVNKIMEWKEATESRITKIEQKFADLEKNFDALHSGVLEKIGEYDKSVAEIGTDIKALEKVFQKILPGFMENVGELSRITQDMKKIKK
ncbi:hypothetical protein KY339_01640 [Candidatus Woesearchaeota archaeon]|nr:hypothetical protein [Candidatus Woesearchaeota archaeon]